MPEAPRSLRSWTARGWSLPTRSKCLPPQLTRSGLNACDAQSPEYFVCTRRNGHTGRHAAGNGSHIVAVWP